MDKLKFTLLFVCCWFCSCQKTEKPSLVEDLTLLRKPPALVITHDISNTFDHVPPPNERLLRDWATYVAKVGGCIGFGLIGDHDSTGNLVRVLFHRGPLPIKNPTYLDQINYEAALDSVTRVNAALIDLFVSGALELLSKHKNHQHTDINGKLDAIGVFFQEPGMENYQHYYYIASDGWQDVKTSVLVDTTLRPQLLPPTVTVLTCGWQNPLKLPHSIRLESPQALTAALKSLIVHQ